VNLDGLLEGLGHATAAALATLVDGDLDGDGDAAITGIEALQWAKGGDLTFIGDARHARLWAESAASVALVDRELDLGDWVRPGRAVVRVDDADQAMITVLESLDEVARAGRDAPAVGVHPTASIDPTATVGDDVAIGAGTIVGPRTVIGDGVSIEAGVRIHADCTIGRGVVIHASVVIRERTMVGDGSILHAGVVLGSDGFGYRPSPDGRGIRKIPHLGHVEIGRDVEIGANSCIDRGKFGATSIGDGSKIDNLCQIGHNCRIGRCVVISGLTGIAGSCTVGDGAMIGGGCGIADHLRVGAGARLGARSGLMHDVPDGETWAGFPAHDIRQAMKEFAVIRKLPDWSKKLKELLEPS